MEQEEMSIGRAWEMLQEISDRTRRMEVQLSELSMPREDNERFLTIEEAAVLIGRKVATVYSKTSRREIPFYKKGKLLQFDRRELLEWIRSGRRKTTLETFEEAGDYLKRSKIKRH